MDEVNKDDWMYGLVLEAGGLENLGAIDPETGKITLVSPGPGKIFRLNGRFPHWSAGHGQTIALFVGGIPEPDDALAIRLLERGLNRLAWGSSRGPRVADYYRGPAENEVWATRDFERLRLVSKEVAERRGWHIEECGLCSNPAYRVDGHWPYDSSMNRCLAHIS